MAYPHGGRQLDGFDALGDATRRKIFERIARRPAAVGEIARVFPISRPAVSQHLKVLKEAGLVRSESAGTRNVYFIDPKGIAAMRTYLDRFWDKALVAFKAAAEKEE